MSKSKRRTTLRKDKERDQVFLQLYSFDLRTGLEEPVKDVQIEEDEWSVENKEKVEKLKRAQSKSPWGNLEPTRPQYNIIFSR